MVVGGYGFCWFEVYFFFVFCRGRGVRVVSLVCGFLMVFIFFLGNYG